MNNLSKNQKYNFYAFGISFKEFMYFSLLEIFMLVNHYLYSNIIFHSQNLFIIALQFLDKLQKYLLSIHILCTKDKGLAKV